MRKFASAILLALVLGLASNACAKSNVVSEDELVQEIAIEGFSQNVYLASSEGNGSYKIIDTYNYGPIMIAYKAKYMGGPHPMGYHIWHGEAFQAGISGFLDTLKKKNGKYVTPDGITLNGKSWVLVSLGDRTLKDLKNGSKFYIMGEIKPGNTSFFYFEDVEDVEKTVSLQVPLY